MLVTASADGITWEVMNTAVVERHCGHGIVRRLLEHTIEQARRSGAKRIELATGAADAGSLRF
ncbi:GNAT family N-acetyltransferase, partial [Nocardia gipuzkoensis]